MRCVPLFGFILLGPVGFAAAADKPLSPEQVQFFEARIRPIFANHCYECHGPQKQRNGLRLDVADGPRKGGDRGPAVVPGKPEESLLIRAINHADLKMPQEKLKPEQIALLTEWVRQGAFYPPTLVVKTGIDWEAGRKHWSFQPVVPPPVPTVKDSSWAKNDIDRFILAALESRGLKPLGPADKRTLIRRVTYDLTGLPPTPDEIDAFLRDNSAEAFAKVVDRLLGSSAYGARWGRHWLDVVRYADTAGDNSDYPIPQMFKYRNWVINAFNRDLPYDQFLREQLAGDLLPARDEADRQQKLIATGYLANTRRFGSYEDARYQWYLTYEDSIDNLGRGLLGLSVNCARCHDHKFDPIAAEDYYALYGIFQSTRYPWPGIELDKVPRDLVALVPADVEARIKNERQQKLAEMDAELKRLGKEKAEADKGLKEAEALPKADKERDQRIKEAKAKQAAIDKATQATRKQRDALAKQPWPFEQAYAVIEKEKASNAKVQLRGDPLKPGKEVPRRFLTILGGQEVTSTSGSGRLELANWIADAKNPLTARVKVNRIWQHHFGRGLVATPNDFGKQGRRPTHPELLDHLAVRFIANGWSIKQLHRLILLSRTYQLASDDDEANEKIDPDNEYHWRYDRRRLDAESIRDTLLALGGNLDRSVGDAHPFPPQTGWDFTQHKPFKAVYESNRRSVYLMTQRIQRHPYLALFDGPDTNASTGQRLSSTTPLQALFLLNDPFVHEQAKGFASRLLKEPGDDSKRIERAYLLAFGRPPTVEERDLSLEHLAKVRAKHRGSGMAEDAAARAAWESFARVVFLMNELVYVE
jgi:mono/diheme cytochrome c family protein